jgi:hypothetical protein
VGFPLFLGIDDVLEAPGFCRPRQEVPSAANFKTPNPTTPHRRICSPTGATRRCPVHHSRFPPSNRTVFAFDVYTSSAGLLAGNCVAADSQRIGPGRPRSLSGPGAVVIMQRVSALLPSWDKTKTSAANTNTTPAAKSRPSLVPVSLDKVFGWAGSSARRASNAAAAPVPASFGREAYWPTTLDKECEKAARILKSFCSTCNQIPNSQLLLTLFRLRWFFCC